MDENEECDELLGFGVWVYTRGHKHSTIFFTKICYILCTIDNKIQ